MLSYLRVSHFNWTGFSVSILGESLGPSNKISDSGTGDVMQQRIRIFDRSLTDQTISIPSSFYVVTSIQVD